MEMLQEKQVRDLITSIRTRGAELDRDIHFCAIQCLLHAEDCGDATLLDTLLISLGRATDIEAFKAWVAAFSPVRWGGKGNIGLLTEKAKTYVAFDVEGADAKPFWEFKAPVVKRALTLEALVAIINGMTKRVDTADNEGLIDGNEAVMRDYVARLQEIQPAVVEEVDGLEDAA